MSTANAYPQAGGDGARPWRRQRPTAAPATTKGGGATPPTGQRPWPLQRPATSPASPREATPRLRSATLVAPQGQRTFVAPESACRYKQMLADLGLLADVSMARQAPPHISPHLPTPPHTSPHLPTSPPRRRVRRAVAGGAGGGAEDARAAARAERGVRSDAHAHARPKLVRAWSAVPASGLTRRPHGLGNGRAAHGHSTRREPSCRPLLS